MLANNGIAQWGLLGRIAGVLVAACCLGYSAWYQAPVNDEFGHFYAGLRYWQYGDVETFKVIPPLLRSLATLPAYLAGMECGQPEDVNQITPLRDVPEFQRGRQLFIQDPSRFQFWLSVGRMLVWSTTILGGVLLYHAAKAHVGIIAGTLAAGLWFAQPQILSHGVLITGDVFCAVIMLATVMTLQWSLRKLTMARSLMLGGMLGLSILAKFTAMVLVPLIFLTFAWHADRYTLKRLLGCIVAGLLATMFLLGLPYGFADWGQDTYRVRDWSNAHAGDVPIYVRSSFCGEKEIRATGAADFYGPVYAIDDLPRPCWLVLSKSNLAIDAPLAEQLRPLEVAEYLAGSHLVYFLPTKDLNSSIRIKNATESPSQ